MRLTTDACSARVSTTTEHTRRPVLLRFAGLTLAMTPQEARGLADELHDNADRAEEMPQ